MTRESTNQYWNEIVITAYRSGEQIRHWCQERGINEKNFHRWAKKLGYTDNGKKTEKFYSLIEDPAINKSADTLAAPVFVEVPQPVLDGFRQPEQAYASSHPLITVQAGSYQISILDGFSEHTLSKVLEVIRYA